MKTYVKRDFPVEDIRQLLEPGPVVLVSSAWKGRTNIMTMGWHAVIEFTPSLVGCVIAETNVSFEMIRRSRQCVINVPTADMADTVVGIGNCDGDQVDKFEKFRLTPQAAAKVKAPLIRECYANLECHPRRAAGEEIQFLHPRGGQGPRRHRPEISAHPPLSRAGDFSHQRPRDQQGAPLHEVEKRPQFLSWRPSASFPALPTP